MLMDTCRAENEQEEKGGQGRDSWCYISGPNGFIDAAERACRQVPGLTTFAARWD